MDLLILYCNACEILLCLFHTSLKRVLFLFILVDKKEKGMFVVRKNLMFVLSVLLLSGPVFASQVNVFGGYNTKETVRFDSADGSSSGELGSSVQDEGAFIVGVEYESQFPLYENWFWNAGLAFVKAEYARTLVPHFNLKYRLHPQVYGFFGLNFTDILESDFVDDLRTVYPETSVSHIGALGAQLGLGVEVHENLSIEVVYDAYNSVAKVDGEEADIEYYGFRIGLKYGFQR